MLGRLPPRAWRLGLPLAVAVVVVLVVVWLSGAVGEQRAERVVDGAAEAAARPPADAGPPPTDAGQPRPDAAYRYDDRGRLVRAPSDEHFVCRRPVIEIPTEAACEGGAGYPACRWQLPDDTVDGAPHEVWRNTTDDHRWGRAALVSLILAVAEEYRERWPGEHLTVGDLDAPGPRHQTHDRGVDVDLYLLEAMIARNEGRGRYPDNYVNRSRREVRALRARVMDLAKIIAVCAGGQIRIYYNDPDLIRPFRAWFEERGLRSDVGRSMRMHNDLHRFHFHLTIPEDLPVLPER